MLGLSTAWFGERSTSRTHWGELPEVPQPTNPPGCTAWGAYLADDDLYNSLEPSEEWQEDQYLILIGL